LAVHASWGTAANEEIFVKVKIRSYNTTRHDNGKGGKGVDGLIEMG